MENPHEANSPAASAIAPVASAPTSPSFSRPRTPDTELPALVADDGPAPERHECEFCDFGGTLAEVESHEPMCMHAPDAQIAPVFPDSSTWSSKMALEVAGDQEFAEVVAVQASVDSVGSEDDLDVGSEDEVEVEQQHEAACDGDAPLELEVLVLEDEAASQPSSSTLVHMTASRASKRAVIGGVEVLEDASTSLVGANRPQQSSSQPPPAADGASKTKSDSKSADSKSPSRFAPKATPKATSNTAKPKRRGTYKNQDDQILERSMAHGLPLSITEPSHRRVERHWGDMSRDIDFQAAGGGPNNDRRGKVIDMKQSQDFIADLRYPYRGDPDCEQAYQAAHLDQHEPLEKTMLRLFPPQNDGRRRRPLTDTPEAAADLAAKTKIEEAAAKAQTVSAFLSSVGTDVTSGLRAAAARKKYWAPHDRDSIRQAVRPRAGGAVFGPSSGGVAVKPGTPHVLSTQSLHEARQTLRKRRGGEERSEVSRRAVSSKDGATPRATPRTLVKTPRATLRTTPMATPRVGGSTPRRARGEGVA